MVELNKNTFSKLIYNQLNISDFNLSSTDEISNKYPYFQSAQLVKAFLLKATDNEYFEVVLPTIAVKVRDRALLYDLVHKPKLVLRNSQNIISELEEKNITELENTENSFINKEDKVVEEIVPIILTEDEVTQVTDANYEVLTRTLEENTPSLIEISVKEFDSSEKILPESEPSFADWLKLKGKNKNTGINSDKIFESIPIQPISSVEVEMIKESGRSMNQLDKFIVEEIIKKQTKKSDLANRSNQVKSVQFELVTETLAEILVDQKKYNEAIETYQKLMLKFPQKSSYFASRIEKINKYE